MIKSVSPNSRNSRLWVGLFFLIYLVVGLSIYKDYGVSWDEPIQRKTGMVTLTYLGEILAPDFIARNKYGEHYPPLAEYTDRDYGVAFELPLSLLEKLLGLDDTRDIYLFRHLLNYLVFFAGVFAVFHLGKRRFSDWRLGLLGALFLILSPRMFAESFYNGKDVVFMALFAIALNSTVHFLQQPTTRMACWHALTTAILVDVRMMGVIIPVATLLMTLMRLGRGELALRTTLVSLLSYLAMSVFLVIAFWPYLWSAPWENFSQAFENMSNFVRRGGEELYLGEFIPTTELPWHYIPVWLAISIPFFYTFLFLLGAMNILRRVLYRRWCLWRGDDEWQDLLFLGLFISPILLVMVLDSVLYDGWRQMYFIYPAFVLVALNGWVMLLRWRPRRHPRIWIGMVGLCTLLSLIHIGVWMVRSHPYQNVYFNKLAGREIKTKFIVDYWGLSSRKALQEILERDKRPSITVWAGSFIPLDNGKLLLESHDRERLHIVKNEVLADYVITNYLRNLTDYSKGSRGYKPFYQIDIDGEAIISVFKR